MSQFPGQKPARHRRSSRYQKESIPDQERGFAPDEDRAPLPLNDEGYERQNQAPVVYDDAVYRPQPPYEQDTYIEEEQYRRWPLFAGAAVLLVLAVFAALYFLAPRDHSLIGKMGSGVRAMLGQKKEEPPKLIKFETPDAETYTGVRVVFTFTTDQKVDGVRMLDENAVEIPGVVQSVNPPENTLWTIAAVFNEPFNRTVYPSILKDGIWYQNTELAMSIDVKNPEAVPTAAPIVSEQTEAPVMQQTGSPDTADTAATEEPEAADEEAAAFDEAATEAPVQAANATMVPGPTFFIQPIISATRAPEQNDSALSEPVDTPAEEPLPDETADEVIDEEPADAAESGDGGDGQAAQGAESEGNQAAAASLPAPTDVPAPDLTFEADGKTAPSKSGFLDAVYLKAKKQTKYEREDPIAFQNADAYSSYDAGILTFRGDHFRRNAAFGTAPVSLKKLSVEWKSPLGKLRTSSGTVYGLGWTGQPAVVKWAVELRKIMKLNDEKKDVKALKEVIVAGQDGKVYFFDLNDGKPTREPINVGFPLKGSVSVDPQGRPLIGFGQGVSKLPGKTGEIGYYLYSLVDNSKLYFINGRKSNAQKQYASNGAFDGTALIDRTTDTLVVGGENGLLYTVALNVRLDIEKGSLTAEPKALTLMSKGKQDNTSVSMESSVAMYKNYAFVADKHGYVRCVDTTTMKTVWAVDTGDNTDATSALDLSDDESLNLYTGTTVFARTRKKGEAVLRKLDALSGKELWKHSEPAQYNKDERGGLKASPVVGEKRISDLVVFTVNLTDKDSSKVIALNKETGEKVWDCPISAEAVSSPVAVYNDNGDAWIVQADCSGRLTMLDGKTGEVTYTLDLGGKIEGSPAIYKDMLIVGTCDSNPQLYGIRIQ